MWIRVIIEWIITIVLIFTSILLLNMFLDIFLTRKYSKSLISIAYVIFGTWQLIITKLCVLPGLLNITVTIFTAIIFSCLSFEGSIIKKCIIIIFFNVIWMMTEVLCGYLFIAFFNNYMANRLMGSAISKGILFLIIKIFSGIFTSRNYGDIPIKLSILLMIIPIGSIFIINNLFEISILFYIENNNLCTLASLIMILYINLMFFSIYIKLEDELRLKQIVLLYKRQLDLYGHEQFEKKSIMQLREIKHNMKNILITIMGYAEKRQCNKIMEFINNVMETKHVLNYNVSNTGNIAVDALINYWFSVAKVKEINFQTAINIPICIPFNDGDICLILGNALENALDAVNKLQGGNKYIKLSMKYDKGNLFISVINTYNGIIIRNREGRLKTTKNNEDSHGIGLISIYHTVEKYHGRVIIKNNQTKFLIKILLYSTK